MVLAAPWLLLVALLVAVPVLAHMRRRTHARDVPFAAIEIAREAVPHERRVRPPDDRVLLALRVLAVLVVALAAAGPTCVRPSPAARADGLAVVLDDSGSMRAPHDAPAFERARRALFRALDEATTPRVAAVRACAPDDVAEGPRAARELLASARVTSAACDPAAAARTALRAVTRAGARRPALVVATDATRTCTPRGTASLGDVARGAGASLFFPLGAAPRTTNVAVTDARFVDDASGVHVEGALACYGRHSPRYTARLVAGGRVLGDADVACAHDGTSAFRIGLATAPGADAGEVVVAGGDVFPDDDVRAVALRPPPRPSVTVVTPSPSRGGAALAEALRATRAFAVREVAPLSLAGALDADVVALVAVADADLSPEAVRALGGRTGAWFVVGAPPRALAGVLPAARTDAHDGRSAADPPRTDHPVAARFDSRRLLPVTATRWWTYTPRPGARVLWTVDDLPVLVVSDDGDARSALLGIPLDEHDADLALRPAWVSLASALTTWLAEPRAHVPASFVAGIDPSESDLRPDALPRTAAADIGTTRKTPLRAHVLVLAFALLLAESVLRARS